MMALEFIFLILAVYFSHSKAQEKLPFCISEPECTRFKCAVTFKTDYLPNANVELELFYQFTKDSTFFHLILSKLGDQLPFLPPNLYQDASEFRYQVNDASLDKKTIHPFKVPYLSETLSPLFFDRGDSLLNRDENGTITYIRTCPIVYFVPLDVGVRFCVDVKNEGKFILKPSNSQPQIIKGYDIKGEGHFWGPDFFVLATYKYRFNRVKGKECHLFTIAKGTDDFGV